MLPDYPELKEKIVAQFIILMKRHVNKVYPLQGMVKRQLIHEGTNPEYQSEYMGHFEDEITNLRTYSAEASFNKDEIRNMSIRDIFLRYLDTAEKMGQDVEINSIQEISNKLTEKGRTEHISELITPEDLLRVINSVSLSFDDKGNVQFPTIMAAPNIVDKFAEVISKLQDEPYKSKMDEIIRKKKIEWNDRENRRKLVD